MTTLTPTQHNADGAKADAPPATLQDLEAELQKLRAERDTIQAGYGELSIRCRRLETENAALYDWIKRLTFQPAQETEPSAEQGPVYRPGDPVVVLKGEYARQTGVVEISTGAAVYLQVETRLAPRKSVSIRLLASAIEHAARPAAAIEQDRS